MINSVYITDAYRFYLYFFFLRDFVVPLSHPLFDLTAPFIAISLHMVHPTPPLAPLVATPPASPPQVVPSFSLDDDDDLLEASESSSGSSFTPNDGYSPTEPDMANGFLSSASD